MIPLSHDVPITTDRGYQCDTCSVAHSFPHNRKQVLLVLNIMTIANSRPPEIWIFGQ